MSAKKQIPSWLESSVFLGGPGKRWTLWVSSILVATVIAASLVVLFWPRPGTDQPSADGSATAGTSAQQQPANEDECEPAAWDDSDIMPPTDLTWTSVAGNQWPMSATTGPTRTIDGLAGCFAHSPIGAALAAVNLTQSLRTADQDTAHDILAAQYVDNDGRRIAADDIDTYFPQQPQESRQFGAVVGYTFVGYTDTIARVVLVEKWPQRVQFTGYTVTVQWSGDDWQVLLDASGQPSPDGEITIDPEAFTYWEVPE